MKFLRRSKTRILLFLAVVGPGFITANVDNDAGGILVYSQAGAQFGHLLLWTMIPVTLSLIVVQEMCARMGAVTGKGLSDLIREEFGFRITFFMMIGILIINFGNVVTEFIGIATSLELFGLSRYATVPVCAVIVWLIVVKGQYKSVEKVFLAASFFYITYIFAGVLAHPLWKDATIATFKPPALKAFKDQAYLFMVIGVVGTTIAPWMQFYLQASVVEKGVTRRGLKASRLDVITGWPGSSSLPAPPRSGFTASATSSTPPMRPRLSSPSPEITPTFCLPSAYSTHRCSRPRFFPFPPHIPFAKVWASNPAWA